MPIIKSAIKRVRSAERRRKRNVVTKQKYRELVKQYLKLVEEKKMAEAGKLFPQVQKAVDMAVKKHLLHANTAGRKKSQLVKMLGEAPKAKKATPAKKEGAPKVEKGEK